MELRDKNGLTEQEYLSHYNPNKYPRPSVTVDIVVLARQKSGLRVLFVRRGGHPHLGMWALPGGFSGPNETTAQAAARELYEETHVSGLKLAPLSLVSDPGRDIRTWTMSQPYAALVDEGAQSVCAGDDADDARWFDIRFAQQDDELELVLTNGDAVLYAALTAVKQITPFGAYWTCEILRQQGFAFDHAKILAQALLILEL